MKRSMPLTSLLFQICSKCSRMIDMTWSPFNMRCSAALVTRRRLRPVAFAEGTCPPYIERVGSVGSGIRPDEASGAPMSGIRTHSLRAEPIQPEEPAVDRHNLDTQQSRRRGKGPYGVGADDRADRRRGLLRHRDREAMNDAP